MSKWNKGRKDKKMKHLGSITDINGARETS